MEDIVKCEVYLDRIFYPKYCKKVDSGEFAIFSAIITKRIENCDDNMYQIKLKGNVCKLEYGITYKVFAKLVESSEQWGNTYEIIYISKVMDISTKDKQREFLRNVLNENLVDKLFDMYDDVIKLLEERDVKSLTKVKGIGNQVALRLIDEYEDSKDYSAIYLELGTLGLTPSFIKKLVDFYHSPDTVIDVVKNNPYDLVRVEGVGFKTADDVACKVGIGKYDIRRIKGFMIHYLNEQGEAGKSYLYYQELMQALYDTLGFVPEEIVMNTAKNMIDNEDVVVLDNGNKIALKRFYKLEENIMNELIRLQIGRVEIEETDDVEWEEFEDQDDLIYELEDIHKDYIPKSFNINNWENLIKEVEEKQGFQFTEEQMKAIKLSLNNNVITITGSAGCVDCDTEFFNGYEWKKISDFKQGDKVLQYNKDGTTELVEPIRYIKQPKEYLWHFETKYGLDQCLSENHNCILISRKNRIKEEKFESVMKRQNDLKFHDKFITTFKYNGEGINLSDNMIRLMVAASADATYDYNAKETWNTFNRCRFRLKKARKISRLLNIIKSLNLDFEIKCFNDDDHVNIFVQLPYRIKEFPKEWYNCTTHQFKIIADEIMYWYGDYYNKKRYSTTIKSNADFIQFVYTSLGKRAYIKEINRVGRKKVVKGKEYTTKSIEYVVCISNHTKVGLCCDKRTDHTPTKFTKYKTLDGYEYCFTVPSHMLVLRRNNKIFITGNCGKTSTANGICSLYNNYNILACALSGKAAVRITEATGLPASTIHKALGYQNGNFIFNKHNKLAVDIVLIDEATMINGTLFLSLLEAIPSGAKVIIMGDVQQLTPIGNCQVFADILDSDALPVVKLTKPHRQALRSGIIPTSIKIASQEQIFNNSFEGNEIIGELQDMELDITSNKENISENIIRHFQKEMEKYNDIMEVQVCVPMRLRGNLSCYNLNTKIQSIYNPKFSEDNEIEIVLQNKKDDVKKYIIRKGDKVLNTKNNYKCINTDGETTPVFNGNIGIIEDIDEDGYVTIDFIGIGKVIFDKSDAKNLELAYACTIHKMQGSGFTCTIVGMDNSSYIMNNCEILYTAVTRAKKYCVLVANNYSVCKAIQTKEVKTKQTFLKDMLLENKYRINKTIKEE